MERQRKGEKENGRRREKKEKRWKQDGYISKIKGLKREIHKEINKLSRGKK